MLMGGVACAPIEDGDEADSDMPELSVSPTSIATNLEGGEQVVTVTSNVNWTVSCDQEDVTIEPLAGSGDGSVTITVPAATAARNFVVTFEGIKKVTVPGIGTQDIPAEPVTVAVSQNDGGVNMDDYLFYENCGLDVAKVNGNWPYLDQFTDWGKQGSAAANVVYSGKNASVRHSGGDYQPTEDAIGVSGAPYVFLNKVPAEAYFVIENIAVTGGSNYIFTYNVSCQNGYNPLTFAAVDNTLVHLELGYDGENWDAVECTFAPNGGNGWYAANAEFKVAADATTLYARFTYEAPASNGGGRFDDFKLVAGGNGAELAPEAPVVAETTIADIKAAGNYSVKNAWAVATYANGCLLTDASGKYLLAYKPSETPAVGEVINIEGGVSAYGGLLQFGEGSTVTKTGETKTVTHPTPEVLDGAKLDALTSALEVKYVEYEGTLAISSGKYFNITVAGASKQGSVQYPLDDMKATLNSLDGKTIKVTGYTIGYTSSKYLQTMATSVVEVEGAVTPDPTPDPEQPGQGGGETPENPETPEVPADGLVLASSDIATVVQSGTYKLTDGTEQKVNNDETWFNVTANGVSFTGCRVMINNNKDPYKTHMQFQGDVSDVAKQGFLGNALAYNDKEIEKIVVEAISSYATPSFNIYYGTEKLPNTNAIATTADNCVKGASAGMDGSYEAFAFTCTFDIPAGNKFFALRNDSKGATYVKSITIVFKK